MKNVVANRLMIEYEKGAKKYWLVKGPMAGHSAKKYQVAKGPMAGRKMD